MTYAAKNPAKGCTVAFGGSGLLLGIAGITEIDVSGKKSKTENATALDGEVFEHMDPTGYSTPPVIKVSGFYDHQTYSTIDGYIAAPSSTPVAVAVTYTGATPGTETYQATGFGIGKKASVGKFQMADVEIQTSGAPS